MDHNLGLNAHTAQPIVLTDNDANLHTLVVGTTGSGKTTTVCNIIESAITRKLPLFYIDGKGDLTLAKQIEAFAKAKQRPFYLFSMIGPSVKYNPLDSGGITSKKDRIIELRIWSEDHYRKIAENYLQTVFSILDTMEIQVDLNTLSQYLDPVHLYSLMRDQKIPALIKQIDKLEDNYKHIQSLTAEIENMAQSEIGGLFQCETGTVLTLEKALAEDAVVYFCLQPLAFPAYAELLGKLIINDLKSLAATQLTLQSQKKIYTVFDEFSVFVGDQIIYLINQGRGAGIHAILCTQSLSDILKKGGEPLLGQILNNCNNYIIQRQNHHKDAELLSQVIGTLDNFEVTSQVNAKGPSTGVGSVRQTKGFIVHPDEVKRLPKGHGIFVNKQKFFVSRSLFTKSAIY